MEKEMLRLSNSEVLILVAMYSNSHSSQAHAGVINPHVFCYHHPNKGCFCRKLQRNEIDSVDFYH